MERGGGGGWGGGGGGVKAITRTASAVKNTDEQTNKITKEKTNRQKERMTYVGRPVFLKYRIEN